MNTVHAWLELAAMCRGYAVAEDDPTRRARWILRARSHILRARASLLIVRANALYHRAA
jgi:hypothetical protein